MAKKERNETEKQFDDAPLCHEGHKKPVTRRDFLAQGAIAGGAYVVAPSLLAGFLGRSSEAHAAAVNCGQTTAGGLGIPFICFDLAGGVSMSNANVIVGDQAGDPTNFTDAGMIKYGLIPGDNTEDIRINNGLIDTQFGLPFHVQSGFRLGMLSKMSASTIANTDGAVICARSGNDTSNNPHNPMYGLYKFVNMANGGGGASMGELVNLIGSRDRDSGGRSIAPASMIDLTQRPTKVSRPSDAMGVADAGRLGQILTNASDRSALLTTIQRMSHRKADALREDAMALQDAMHRATFCSASDARETFTRVGNPNLLDPRQDQAITGGGGFTPIFSVAEADRGGSRNDIFAKTASIMKLVVNGWAGAGTVEVGGYDYHNGTRTTGDTRDFEAGQAIGAALEYAARMNQQLMVYVFSDGSVAGDRGGQTDGSGRIVWRGDNGGTAAVFMLVYNPPGRGGRVTMRTRQIGYARDSASVETNANAVANNVEALAYSIVLNYMALHNMEGQFTNYFGTNILGSGSDLDQYIAFSNIRTALT